MEFSTVNAEKVNEVNRLVMALARARGAEDKLAAAADLLAELGVIHSTPAAKRNWQDDFTTI